MSKTTAAIVGLCAFAAGLLLGLLAASLTSESLREVIAERDRLAQEVVEKTAEGAEVRAAGEQLRLPWYVTLLISFGFLILGWALGIISPPLTDRLRVKVSGPKLSLEIDPCISTPAKNGETKKFYVRVKVKNVKGRIAHACRGHLVGFEEWDDASQAFVPVFSDRRDDEAFHEIIVSWHPDNYPFEKPSGMYCLADLPGSGTVRLTDERTFYKPGEPVGKSCDQVGRSLNGDIVSGDSDVYAKWSQALSSADDLTYLACRDGEDRTGDVALSLVFPILVVPNGRLWMTQYDCDGKRIRDPENVDRCSYFVHLLYFHRDGRAGHEVTISHLEFVTVDGLVAFVDEICGDEDKLAASYPSEHVANHLGAT